MRLFCDLEMGVLKTVSHVTFFPSSGSLKFSQNFLALLNIFSKRNLFGIYR